MADKKKVVRRTAEERKAALEQELKDLELKEVERARKQLTAKQERLAKVLELAKKYENEADELENEIAALEATIGDEDGVFVGASEQAEEVSQPTLSAAG